MTKREKQIYEDYKNSLYYELGDRYSRWSKGKAEAWDECKRLCYENRGKGLKIISANGWMFTAGFLFDNGTKLMYITPSRDEVIKL